MSITLINQKFRHTLDSKLIESIEQIGIFRHFKRNDIIIDLNQPLRHIPLLLEGYIKILREDAAGNELLIYFLEAGDTCTMSLTCCLGDARSKVRAVAEQDSTLVMIPVEYINQWFHQNDSWRNFILESYQSRFDEMLETIDTIAFMKMDERLYKYLMDKSKLQGSNSIIVKHQDIAVDLHTSRVVISRLLKQLENENKIQLSRNKIKVL